MNNKIVYIRTIIRSSVIFVCLIYIIINIQDLFSRIMIFPFLLCSLFLIGKNLCLLIEKIKIAVIFSKLFVICFLAYWFGILIGGCYSFIKAKDYFSIIFTIPFWIGGIYVTRKYLFEKKQNL